jgi:hypothetical protein
MAVPYTIARSLASGIRDRRRDCALSACQARFFTFLPQFSVDERPAFPSGCVGWRDGH